MGGLQLGVNKMLDIVTNPQIDLPKTVFAEAPHHSRNANTYSHIYTPDVIDALAEHGFKPVAVSKRNVRKADRFGFEKHLIRFRRTDAVPVTKVGDTIPEFVWTNSHDGTSAAQAWLGVFRLACANGLVVCTNTFGKITIPHRGRGLMDRVIDAAYQVIDQSDRTLAAIDTWSTIDMGERQQLDFAARALNLRFPDASQSPIEPEQLLTINRMDDRGPDLWKVFNRVQENLLRGKILGFNKTDDKGNRVASRLRAIRGPEKTIELNAKLWQMAAEYAEAA